MRNAQAEAAARVNGRFDVRVLEPSPPAVGEPPFFADDPVSGGEIVPVERPGARSWAALCEEEAGTDPGLAAWCADRWLVRKPLEALPPAFVDTRLALHALAEHVVAPARHTSNGKIGLRFTYHGFGTPFFGDDRQLRVEDGVLVDGDQRHAPATLADAAAFVGMAAGAPADVYHATTPLDLDAPLAVDPAAARVLGDWFGLCASVLEQLRAEASADDSPSRLQLWPEHFDLAVDMGPDGSRANFGGSPGDAGHPEPYLYVGPWGPRSGDEYWNEPFGASLSYGRLLDGADPLDFLRRGRTLLSPPRTGHL